MRKKIYTSSELKKIKRIFATAVFLDYIDKNGIPNRYVQPSYFKDELGIVDGNLFKKKMIRKGYIKSDKNEKTILTEKGNRFIDEYSDYIKFFKKAIPSMDIFDYDRIKRRAVDTDSFEKIMISALIVKMKELKNNDDYDAVRQLNQEIGAIYSDINYNSKSIYYYLTSLYFQVSGLEYYDAFIDYMLKMITRDELLNMWNGVHISYDTVYAISKLKEYINYEIIEKVFKDNPISINLCKRDIFISLIEDIKKEIYIYEDKKWQEIFYNAFIDMIAIADNKKRNIF